MTNHKWIKKWSGPTHDTYYCSKCYLGKEAHKMLWFKNLMSVRELSQTPLLPGDLFSNLFFFENGNIFNDKKYKESDFNCSELQLKNLL